MLAGNTSARRPPYRLIITLTFAIDTTFQFAVGTPLTSVSNPPFPPPKNKTQFDSLLLPPHAARTLQVNGTFTPPQRELYAALLATQKALVRECAVSRLARADRPAVRGARLGARAVPTLFDPSHRHRRVSLLFLLLFPLLFSFLFCPPPPFSPLS